MSEFTAALLEVHREMRAIMGAVARGAGLTAQQIELMCVLKQHGEPSFGQLAELLGCDKTNITGMADRLIRHGFAARETDPADRRVTRLRLTETGRAFEDRVRAEVAAAVDARWTGASDRDRAGLVRLVAGR